RRSRPRATLTINPRLSPPFWSRWQFRRLRRRSARPPGGGRLGRESLNDPAALSTPRTMAGIHIPKLRDEDESERTASRRMRGAGQPGSSCRTLVRTGGAMSTKDHCRELRLSSADDDLIAEASGLL